LHEFVVDLWRKEANGGTPSIKTLDVLDAITDAIPPVSYDKHPVSFGEWSGWVQIYLTVFYTASCCLLVGRIVHRLYGVSQLALEASRYTEKGKRELGRQLLYVATMAHSVAEVHRVVSHGFFWSVGELPVGYGPLWERDAVRSRNDVVPRPYGDIREMFEVVGADRHGLSRTLVEMPSFSLTSLVHKSRILQISLRGGLGITDDQSEWESVHVARRQLEAALRTESSLKFSRTEDGVLGLVVDE
jgi:hypothetical protein